MLGIHDRTYLQEIEGAGLIIIEIAGKLYLDRALHFVGTESLYRLKQFRQREYTMLQDTTERDDLTSTFIDTIADNLVHGIISGCDIGKGPILCSLFHTHLLDIKAVIDLEIIADMGHVQSIEPRLGLRECSLHL